MSSKLRQITTKASASDYNKNRKRLSQRQDSLFLFLGCI